LGVGFDLSAAGAGAAGAATSSFHDDKVAIVAKDPPVRTVWRKQGAEMGGVRHRIYTHSEARQRACDEGRDDLLSITGR
jgi:hypothetical protein